MKTCPACGAKNIAGAELCDECGADLAQLDLPAPGKGMSRRIMEGTIADLPPRKAVAVEASATVGDALALMRRDRIGCVLVTERGRMVGVLTERDVLNKAAHKLEPLAEPVRALMNKPESLKEADRIGFAFHTMAVGGYRHLPILLRDGGFGIISARDLLRYLCK